MFVDWKISANAQHCRREISENELEFGYVCAFGMDHERDSTQNPRNRSIPGWLFRHDAGQSKTQTYFDDKIVIKIVEDAENAAFNIAASYCFFKDSD